MSPGRYRGMSKYAECPQVCECTTALSWRPAGWRLRRGKGLAKARDPSQSAEFFSSGSDCCYILVPVLETRSRVFCGKPRLCLLLPRRVLLRSSPTSHRKQAPATKTLTAMQPMDKPGTAAAAEAPTTDVQAGSSNS